ncbi:aldo/keto reductase [Streptomyces albidoflavus]|uniref:Pau7 n=2 Tax=Streptomyces TaxID=1883 RepID=A0A075EYE9_9ACTN|nr:MULTISPECIES: aldo/keto reductase [Streptomyces]AIE54174.1 Pau7 [Streptomyces paulus]BDH49619.1 oxidoreductase [Streptomyces albus]AGI87011.1 Oxidoreductase [Streptomyces albidoflavus]EFE84874.1 oxidoreductase [Streptomyces albidoflavus]QLP90782.1 Oxidoreductase [Streptomyces albidoflavus]
MNRIPSVTLNTGVPMPQLGLGVWQVPDAQAPEVVVTALEAGYRKIDTASAYGNEVGTGKGISMSGIPRQEVFVTTKVWNTDHGYDSTLGAFDQSLDRLGLDYVDLYLIHWPVPSAGRYVETYRALERIHAEGRARVIGVSNFLREHLDRLAAETDVVPAVNQIELHPQHQQAAARALHAERGIVTEAWSPLGSGRGLLDGPAVAAVARKHGKSPGQVVLRWHLQLGHVVVPKSAHPGRIAENADVFDFSLDASDMAAFAALEEGRPLGPAPR